MSIREISPVYPQASMQEQQLSVDFSHNDTVFPLTVWGDPAIWTNVTGGSPSLALLSSSRVPASILLQIHDWARHWRQHGPIVISGFQSETENEALQVLLGGVQPVVLVLARGMLKRLRPEYRQPVEEGRLLLVSPFPDSVQWVSAENAQVRNRLVCALADEVLIAHAESRSKTEALAQEITGWSKPLWTVEHSANRNLQAMGFETYRAQ
jgi:predicted Rossmann fold nucleotide-binding protein DprA/Smf involved in DNA uptake